MIKQAIDGRAIYVRLDTVNEMVRLLSDVAVLKDHYDELWTQAKEILRRSATSKGGNPVAATWKR
jgi:hypothetical protein